MKNISVYILALALLAPANGFALTHMDMNELLAQADLVAVGYTISVDQDVETTRAQVQLIQVLKGRGEAPGGLVTIESPGGKVYIDESQPSFRVRHNDLLFLKKNAERYACVNQADGQKTIHGENVYPYHDNAAYGVPLKDYLESLEAAVKATAAPSEKT